MAAGRRRARVCKAQFGLAFTPMKLTDEQVALVEDNWERAHAVAARLSNVKGISYDRVRENIGEALVRCAQGFDPERGFTFSTYLYEHLPKRMIDIYRETNLSLRSSNSEVMQERKQAIIAPILASGPPAGESNTDATLLELMAPSYIDPGYEQVEVDENLGRALGMLAPHVRKMVHLRLQGEALAAIGEVFDISESRVSQVFKQIREFLERAIAGEDQLHEYLPQTLKATSARHGGQVSKARRAHEQMTAPKSRPRNPRGHMTKERRAELHRLMAEWVDGARKDPAA